MRQLTFHNIKKKFEQQSGDDRRLRERLKRALPGPCEFKEMSFNSHSIVLVAVNKAIAQELFLKREALQKEFKREIVIR